MCGIIGYIGPRQAAPVLLDGLRRLEYRGYDSAGLALLNGHVEVIKAVGRVANLVEAVPEDSDAHTGIAHTRWATHGGVTHANAHPHVDENTDVAVVHNGIIENFTTLRQKLVAEGHTFRSETDTELLPHLIRRHYNGDPVEAVLKPLPPPAR